MRDVVTRRKKHDNTECKNTTYFIKGGNPYKISLFLFLSFSLFL